VGKPTSRVKNFSNFSLREGRPLILNSLTNVSSSIHCSTLPHILLTTLSIDGRNPILMRIPIRGKLNG